MYLDVHKDSEKRMKKTVEVYRNDLQSIRAGRANPALLDKIMVEYYGQMTPLSQVASVSAPEPRLLAIQPWEAKLVPEIEKQILKSDLGINPSNDGKIVRLQIPELTEERRADLTRLVKKSGEDAKVSIRNIRREGISSIQKMEKNKELTEDEKQQAEDHMQEITDKYVNEVDVAIKSKEEELMEI
ncbi:MAG TPA: ribosome recycling factor [Tissierellaceae bacterium]|nr:ribosome recycling factor [Tissierellaceae bacterium]